MNSRTPAELRARYTFIDYYVFLPPGEKGPCWTKGWQNPNHKTTDEELAEYLSKGNIGAIMGDLSNVMCLDIDNDKHIPLLFPNGLPDTFSESRTLPDGHKKYHFFFIHDPALDNYNSGDGLELLSQNSKDGTRRKQVFLSPRAGLSKTGTPWQSYEPLCTSPPIPLPFPLKEYLKAKMKPKIACETKLEASGPQVPLPQIIDTSKLYRTDEGYQGTHPYHDSEGGQNFTIDTAKNVWHCFRHDCGGGWLQLLAMKEGLLQCGDKLRGQAFIKAAQIAKEKYGINVLEEKEKGDRKKQDISLNDLVYVHGDQTTGQTLGFIPEFNVYEFKLGKGRETLYLFTKPDKKLQLGDCSVYIEPFSGIGDMDKPEHIFLLKAAKNLGIPTTADKKTLRDSEIWDNIRAKNNVYPAFFQLASPLSDSEIQVIKDTWTAEKHEESFKDYLTSIKN